MKGATAEDIASRAAMDERNNRGAEGWSPSRAREVLRERISLAVRNLDTYGLETVRDKWLDLHRSADRNRAFDDPSQFLSFWLNCVDMSPPAL